MVTAYVETIVVIVTVDTEHVVLGERPAAVPVPSPALSFNQSLP